MSDIRRSLRSKHKANCAGIAVVSAAVDFSAYIFEQKHINDLLTQAILVKIREKNIVSQRAFAIIVDEQVWRGLDLAASLKGLYYFDEVIHKETTEEAAEAMLEFNAKYGLNEETDLVLVIDRNSNKLSLEAPGLELIEVELDVVVREYLGSA